MTRRISIFGSTGSVGTSTVDLVLRNRDSFRVVALSGHRNIELLATQARALRPEVTVIADEGLRESLDNALAGTGLTVTAGAAALLEAASIPADWTMSAIVGFAGLDVTLKAARTARVLALANKESLVCAGPLVQAACAESRCKLLPVDSEHSAIFQLLPDGDLSAIESICLTASGGPFLRYPLERMAGVTPEQAACHPNWDMGTRISIDSASLFNKAMEVIELRELFGIDPDRIEVLVHPQSLVHALVTYVDQGMFAHLGPADMRHPIGFALNWPDRQPLPMKPLDLAEQGSLTFERPDRVRFPALDLADAAMKHGGLAGAVFNGAKERALDRFIAGDCGFTDMAPFVGDVLSLHFGRMSAGLNLSSFDLEDVKEADRWARSTIDDIVGGA